MNLFSCFWNYLDDDDVSEASNDGAGLVIKFDGNLQAWEKIIPKYLRHQNPY